MTRTLLAAFMFMVSSPLWGTPPEPPDPELRRLLARALAEEVKVDYFDAEVWLTDMSSRLQKRLPSEQQRLEFLRQVYVEAHRVKLPPELVLAVIDVESNFNQFAISKAGAQGYMQVMPFWLKEIGRPDDNLFRAATNLRMGCTILRYYYDKEGGDWMRALARYNGSLGRQKYPLRVFDALRQRWRAG